MYISVFDRPVTTFVTMQPGLYMVRLYRAEVNMPKKQSVCTAARRGVNIFLHSSRSSLGYAKLIR